MFICSCLKRRPTAEASLRESDEPGPPMATSLWTKLCGRPSAWSDANWPAAAAAAAAAATTTTTVAFVYR